MRPSTIFLASVLLLWAPAPLVQAQQQPHRLKVHGRLNHYNGRWGFYIWPVGTKRRLFIHESKDYIPDMPKALLTLISTQDRDRQVFADFIVVPLTPYKEGEAQEVRIVSASHLVVVENGKVILMKKDL